MNEFGSLNVGCLAVVRKEFLARDHDDDRYFAWSQCRVNSLIIPLQFFDRKHGVASFIFLKDEELFMSASIHVDFVDLMFSVVA